MEATHFKKGDEVEISSDEVGFRGAWFAGAVVRAGTGRKEKVLVQYKHLVEEGKKKKVKPLRELVNPLQLRPAPPRDLGRVLSVSDDVDAFFNDGWWEGVITDDLGGGRFSVFFRSSREQLEFDHGDLRYHREWIEEEWIPPVEEEVNKSSEEGTSDKTSNHEAAAPRKVKPCRGQVKKTLKKGKADEMHSDQALAPRKVKREPRNRKVKEPLKKGTADENSGDGTPAPSEGKHHLRNGEVEETLKEGSTDAIASDEAPAPSEVKNHLRNGKVKKTVKKGSAVDKALTSSAVKPCKGKLEKTLKRGTADKSTADEVPIPSNGNVIETSKHGTLNETSCGEAGERELKKTFKKGSVVEISSDEDGFQGAWFAGTVIELIGKDAFLVEYQCLRTEDDKELVKEEIDNLHIRPYPPAISEPESFSILDEVDALYNDGWWVGVISKIHKGSKYTVYFKGTDDKMKFKHSELRKHQDWIDGKWVITSQAINGVTTTDEDSKGEEATGENPPKKRKMR